jgi:hypothetical protein
VEQVLLTTDESIVDQFELIGSARKNKTSIIFSNKRLYYIGKSIKRGLMSKGTTFINLSSIYSAQKVITKNPYFIVFGILFVFVGIFGYHLITQLSSYGTMGWGSIAFIVSCSFVAALLINGFFITSQKKIKINYGYNKEANIPCGKMSEARVHELFSAIARGSDL